MANSDLHRIAVCASVWQIAETAAKTGQVVDVGSVAEDLLQRHPESGLSRDEVVQRLEKAAVTTRAPIFSDRRSSGI